MSVVVAYAAEISYTGSVVYAFLPLFDQIIRVPSDFPICSSFTTVAIESVQDRSAEQCVDSMSQHRPSPRYYDRCGYGDVRCDVSGGVVEWDIGTRIWDAYMLETCLSVYLPT